MVHVLLKPGLENFERYCPRCEMSGSLSCVVVGAFFDIAFLWDWNEKWQFPVLWPLLSFPTQLAFWNPACTSESSQFTYCWSLVWRVLIITLLACEMSSIVQLFEHSLALPFFGMGLKTDLFQSCGHCWVFQICWHIECSTFTASSFRIWNNSAGIPSPLGFFVVMLPKAHLTSHYKMSGSRWVIIPLWLSVIKIFFCIVLLCILATTS